MALELLVEDQSGQAWDLTPSAQSVTWTTNRTGSPGTLKFTLILKDSVPFSEGASVRFSDDGEVQFFGWVFTISRDRWGTTISFPEDAPGAIPVHSEELTVCPDVTRWEETVHAPDLAANCTQGWEACRTAARSAAGEEKLLAGFMGTGIFEQCHFLMGFENTLTALYEHPEEMHRLIDYITDYRLGYVKLLIDNLHPDVIFSHDDWGTKDALFMHPDMWREFFKGPYRRF